VPDERPSDAHVVSLLREGRRDGALEALVERFRQKVFHLALSYLRSPEDAEDLAQDAFVRIWRALPSYDGRASLSTWIYVIARNACLSELRRRRLRVTSPLGGSGEDADPEARPEAPRLEARLDCDALLRRLPDPQRQVVALFYLEERSYEQVAEILDMPVNTVRSHLHRARRRLALSLGGGGDDRLR
jgi:RNA polymerase sigma-70 factor (ECF subfamily)